MKYRIESEVTLFGGRIVRYTFEQEFAEDATPEEIERVRRMRMLTTFLMSGSKAIKVERIG